MCQAYLANRWWIVFRCKPCGDELELLLVDPVEAQREAYNGPVHLHKRDMPSKWERLEKEASHALREEQQHGARKEASLCRSQHQYQPVV